MNAIKFIKAHGLGNDFVIIEAFNDSTMMLSASKILEISNRRTGVGCDQLIILKNSEKADCLMHIFNADGSKAEACGNATRCVAYIMMNKLAKKEVVLEINGSLFAAHLENNMIAVNMGKPEFSWNLIPTLKPVDKLASDYFAPLHDPILVNVGNPHIIFFVDNLNEYNLSEIGPRIENDPLFPNRINVSLAEIIEPNKIKLAVWERGVGLTDACGTAACAAGVAYMNRYKKHGPVDVSFRRGHIRIQLLGDGSIEMTGEAHVSFIGELSNL